MSVGVIIPTETRTIPQNSTLNNKGTTTLSNGLTPLKSDYSLSPYEPIDDEKIYVDSVKDLNKQIGWAVSMFEPSLVIYTTFEIKSHDITFPKISKYSREVDPFTGSLLCSMRTNTIRYGNGNRIEFDFDYYITQNEYYSLLDFSKEFVEKMVGMSDYEKVKYTHDYLIDNCTYDINRDGPYNCIFGKRSNCNGYALAFCLIMRECNIECKYVTGLNHAWNAVKLGSFWYNIDVTWDDTGKGISYDYFLKGRSDWKRHDSTEATAGYSYSQSEFANWVGTIVYKGWWIFLLVGGLTIYIIYKRKNKETYY